MRGTNLPHPEERSAGARLEGRTAPLRRLLPSAASPLLWVAVLFFALLIGMPRLRPVFHWAFPEVNPPVFARGSFVALFLSHAGLVLAASLGATLLGIGLAVFVTRPVGRDFRPIVNALATV